MLAMGRPHREALGKTFLKPNRKNFLKVALVATLTLHNGESVVSIAIVLVATQHALEYRTSDVLGYH